MLTALLTARGAVPVKSTTPVQIAAGTLDLVMTSVLPVSGRIVWTAPIARRDPSGSLISAVRVYRSGMATIVRVTLASAI
jgi:hypothetical protein